jgi:hypothetical protein
MRVSRIAAITVMGAAAFGVSATSAYADYGTSHKDMSSHSKWDKRKWDERKPGEIEASPTAVKPGHVVRLSTEDCHKCGPVKVHIDIDGVRHWVKLAKWTPEGKTGSFKVPRDTDPGKYKVEGHCKWGRKLEGSFEVKKDPRWHHHMKRHHDCDHHKHHEHKHHEHEDKH